MNRHFLFVVILGGLVLFLLSCSQVRTAEVNDSEETISETEVLSPTQYDFFIENSGSVKGFFNGDTNAKTVLKQFYDRIDEKMIEGDTITLNFINTTIRQYKDTIGKYIQEAYNNCNASYSKIDDILSLAMDNSLAGNVSLLMSDYCFESNTGNFQTAKSGITNIITKKLKNADLAIAIFKFNSNFRGRYFPGGINCNQELPFYIWVFGPVSKVKKIVELPNIEMENMLIFQPHLELSHQIVSTNARMKGPEGSVKVKHMKKDRRNNGYELVCKFDVSRLILSEDSLKNMRTYTTTSGYEIQKIDIKGHESMMNIFTNHPHPGVLSISYDYKLPDWVEKSNFEGNGIPPVGQTLGIKYLIEGVYDAYHNGNSSLFDIKISMK